MPLRSRQNQYCGINAHLHSVLQNDGGWDSFHSNYISDLSEAIDRELPPGYLVDVERSLQIREFHPDTGELQVRQRKPDLTIYDTQPTRQPSAATGGTATLVQPLVETLTITDESFYSSIVIYAQQDDKSFGKPIIRLEILSPTNKASGQGYFQYTDKRYAALKSGLRLIEVDYLHESASPINGIPVYPKQNNSFPYSITFSNPTPSLQQGISETYEFSVDEAVPTLEIPLSNNDQISLNFGSVYNRTFRKLQVYSYLVDYEQLPVHFERYSPTDQERIRRRMQAVITARQAGHNLEKGPFPLIDT